MTMDGVDDGDDCLFDFYDVPHSLDGVVQLIISIIEYPYKRIDV
jgi:hypothetical protein